MPTQEDIDALSLRIAALEEGQFTTSHIWSRSTEAKQWNNISIPYNIDENMYRSVYSVALPTLYPGDVVFASGVAPITNPYSYIIMIGRFLVLTPEAPTGKLPEHMAFETLGERIAAPVARNILPGTHHDFYNVSGTYKVNDTLENRYANLIVYGASHMIPGPDQYAPVDPGGRLDVFVFRSGIVDCG